MLATNTSHSVLQISWVVTKHKKNGNLDIHFPLKLIKRSVSFGYKREMLSWALIVDSIEMRYTFLNWNVSRIMPIVPTSMTQTSQKRRLCWERSERRRNTWQPREWFTPVQRKKFTKLLLKLHLHVPSDVYKIQAILYSAYRKSERIVPLQKNV